MPRVLVSDTNIWVDFHRAGLLDALFSLPYEFCTTDFVKAELIAPEAKRLISLGLKIHGLDGSEINQLGSLMQSLNHSSLADVSCFFLADKLKCPLLTGDGRLRKLAAKRSVVVHGSLWLLDRLVETKAISKKKAADALKAMIDEESRFPEDECRKRFSAWGA